MEGGAIDTRGNNDLAPEQALTYNAGIVLLLKRANLTLDYWSYDFENVIDVLPYSRIADLYSEEETREAVKQYVGCADGVGTGTCDPATIERVQVNLVNWPGLKTSGFDWHLSTRFPAGAGELSSGLDGTYTREYDVRALLLNGLELQPAQEAAACRARGRLDWPRRHPRGRSPQHRPAARSATIRRGRSCSASPKTPPRG